MKLAPFVALMHGPALVAHGVVTLGLCRFVSPGTAAVAGLGSWTFTALRVGTLLRDWRRRRWVIQFLDEPVYWHWGGCLFAVPPFVLGAIALLVVRLATN